MNRLYSTIGLAYKSKNLSFGADKVIHEMKTKKTRLILVNATASINTIKNIQNKANFYDVPYIILNDMEENLEKIFNGKKIKIIGVQKKGFEKLIKKIIEEKNGKN